MPTLKTRASCSSGGSGRRKPASGWGPSGSTEWKPARSKSTLAELSTTSATVLKPTQRPDQRDIAQPCRPSSSRSRTSAGTSTGMWAAISAGSLWCGTVEDLQAWSSPAIASTPPVRAVPA